MEIELEKTYLAKILPTLADFDFISEMKDVYIPLDSDHPQIRLRRQGTKLFLTKKVPATSGQGFEEYTIPLSEKEYSVFEEIKGRVLAKTRYNKTISPDIICHLDVYKENLQGLVIVDFEFKSEEAMSKFTAPDYCLTEIPKKGPLAGGLLAGKSFADLEEWIFKEYKYTKLTS
jgi:CYTH domain-containing protein